MNTPHFNVVIDSFRIQVFLIIGNSAFCGRQSGHEREREMSLHLALKLLLFLLPLVSGEQLSSKECENLGFTGLALCSDCNTFAEYVKNEELVSDCKKCCTEDSDDSMSKFSQEECVRSSNIFVGLMEMEVCHGNVRKVDNWKREHLLHFLREKVKPSSSAI
ncbi:PREDICTED: uncharacterized protein LOC104605318 [Nelumbo nucifera]|uniref:Uncharacterized protein LOC104605318 n=1 Tax=Nelumbo nucifera TaxID=4432 RepID=A0A1U8Q968_NELNU|nr:PREDICTED: uncharacterized protein LOC104605318 [Nelumbo nucifera]